VTITTSTSQAREGTSISARLLRRGVGIGAAAALITAGAASAATDVQHAAGVTGGTPIQAIVASQKPYTSVIASPRTLTPGQRITITGNAPRAAHAGQWITLESHAFSSKFTSDGIPSVRAQVLVNGTYRVTVPLRRSLSPATYTVRGGYRGQPLDTVARISVR
jgi:hypothetical protein